MRCSFPLALIALLCPLAAIAAPCPTSPDFWLEASSYQGPVNATDGENVPKDCAPIHLEGSFTLAEDSGSNSIDADRSIAARAVVAGAWGGVNGVGAVSGTAATLLDTFTVTGVPGPTAPVQIAVHYAGRMDRTGDLEVFATDAQGTFTIVDDTKYVPDDAGPIFVNCFVYGTLTITCNDTLHGTVPVGVPVPIYASVALALHADASDTFPTGSGQAEGSMSLHWQVTSPTGGTVELASSQYLPEPAHAAVAAVGALSLLRRRERRRSPRSRRPVSACS